MTEAVLIPLWNVIGWLVVWRFSLVCVYRSRRWAIAARLMADDRVPVDISVPHWAGQFVDLRKWTYRQFFPVPPQPQPNNPNNPPWSARAVVPLVYQSVINLCDDLPLLRAVLADAQLLPENTESDKELWLRTVRVVTRISVYGEVDDDAPPIPRH